MLTPTYLNVFIQPAYTYLLPTYLVVNLNMNSTQSNGSLSINHFTNKNKKVQIDYPLTMACPN